MVNLSNQWRSTPTLLTPSQLLPLLDEPDAQAEEWSEGVFAKDTVAAHSGSSSPPDPKFRGQNLPQSPQNRTLKLDDLIRVASDLPDSQLQQLYEAIGALLDARDLGDKDPPQTPQNRTLNQDDRPGGRGHIEQKMVNGCGPYRYLRWWSGGKHRSTYLGKVEREE